MGRPRKMTARALKKRIDAYFDSIRAEKPMMLREPVLQADGTPALDAFGHEKMVYKPVITADGKPATETIWTEPPSIIGLCMAIGVDRTTFYRWCNPGDEPGEEEKEFCNIATRARGRIEAYLTAKTEEKSAARGAIANLEANFGWKRRKEIGLDEQTQRAVAMTAMTTEEKLQELQKMGVKIDFLETEGQEDDE